MSAKPVPMPLTQRYFDLVWHIFCDSLDDLIDDQRAKTNWSVSAEVYESIADEWRTVVQIQALAEGR